MVNWLQFQDEVPELAARVVARISAHKHLTMATIRRDGGPRISGTGVEIRRGEVLLGGRPGNRRFADLRRDSRVEIHSGSDEPDVWAGDAKLSGTAVEVSDPAALEAFRADAREVPAGPFELFRVELTQVAVVRLSDARDHLLIDTWHAERGTGPTVRR